ncbi:DcaP family trimeric outer membrane transporter [Glaciecola sp. 1036]|uniref:DcaP family trimeric outer membrane transporter n=1 Tax=Alteromonadaceae TaxID=72275 RepID=UPI003CFC5B13
MKLNKNKLALATLISSSLMLSSGLANAGVELVKVPVDGEELSVVMGGYAKVDVRHVSGDVQYQDYWLANIPGGGPLDTSHTGFNIRESRVNFKVTKGDVYGVVEIDFYGDNGNANEVVSNSNNPRLRHFYFGYKNWMVGQNWSTFMPLHSLPEALDFGGPHVGEVFIRQTQIRYTNGPWQFAIENPETNGDGDVGRPSGAVGLSGSQADPDETIPDFVARYNLTKDWGTVSFGALIRKVDQGGLDETAIAASIAGKIKTVGKDDFRFSLQLGEPGRYVAAAMTPDIVTNADDQVEVEQTTAFTVAYRHFWNESTRSTAYYGQAETDVLGRKRSHGAINLITDVTKSLNVGAELGQFSVDDEGILSFDSIYLQFSAKYAF